MSSGLCYCVGLRFEVSAFCFYSCFPFIFSGRSVVGWRSCVRSQSFSRAERICLPADRCVSHSLGIGWIQFLAGNKSTATRNAPNTEIGNRNRKSSRTATAMTKRSRQPAAKCLLEQLETPPLTSFGCRLTDWDDGLLPYPCFIAVVAAGFHAFLWLGAMSLRRWKVPRPQHLLPHRQ
jgi:hypothetical protein